MRHAAQRAQGEAALLAVQGRPRVPEVEPCDGEEELIPNDAVV